MLMNIYNFVFLTLNKIKLSFVLINSCTQKVNSVLILYIDNYYVLLWLNINGFIIYMVSNTIFISKDNFF